MGLVLSKNLRKSCTKYPISCQHHKLISTSYISLCDFRDRNESKIFHTVIPKGSRHGQPRRFFVWQPDTMHAWLIMQTENPPFALSYTLSLP